MVGRDKHGYELYHVWFCGCKKDNIKSNILVTYNDRKAPQLDLLIQKRAEGKFFGKLFMDSGAYPASKKGTDIDIDRYIDYANRYGDHLEYIVQVDYINRPSDGTATQRAEKSIALTWERFLYTWERTRPELRSKLVYVTHEAEPIEEALRNAMLWRDPQGNKIERMAIGLATPDPQVRSNHARTLTKVALETGYEGKVHALGTTVADVINLSPFITSSDSSSAIRQQMTANVLVQGQMIKIGDDTAVHHKSKIPAAYRAIIDQKLRTRAEELGIDYDRARVSAEERYAWNIAEMDDYLYANVK